MKKINKLFITFAITCVMAIGYSQTVSAKDSRAKAVNDFKTIIQFINPNLYVGQVCCIKRIKMSSLSSTQSRLIINCTPNK